MKGIILAGGLGTRLYPSSCVINKQLLPVYDKPMIYYPLSTLMQAGIKDILIISTPRDLPRYEEILGNGHRLGLDITFMAEEKPKGIAYCFTIGEEFIDGDPVCLILGDNIFYGEGLPRVLKKIGQYQDGALIFGYWVNDPGRFGVVEFDSKGRVLNIEEKPLKPKSQYAVPGLYFYDCQVLQIVKNLKPSSRGELEITDVNKEYLKLGKLRVELMSRGIAWLDTGTPESLLEAAGFIAHIENRQGIKIGCIEETSYKMGFINKRQFRKIIAGLPPGNYANYLKSLVNNNK